MLSAVCASDTHLKRSRSVSRRTDMPTHKHIPSSVTWDQVAAFRLARHHLAKRAPKKALVQVALEMGGAQAQLLSAAQLSLWARVRNLRLADIEEAFRERTLVKAGCMRRTLFLVPSEHLATFVRGSAGRAEKEVRWARGKGVPERLIEAAIEAALAALDVPRTRPEIAERACRTLGVQTRLIHGGGWGNRRPLVGVPVGDLTYPVVDLLHLTAARGVVCYGPNRGNESTFVRADAWIPNWQDLPREEAEGRLLRLYLGAFGPATAADFAMWTGISQTEARAIWQREHAGFAPVEVEGRTAEVLRGDLDDLMRARIKPPLVRLLPYFDSFLLGHRDRDHLLATEHRSKVYRPQGWIAPVVLVNGRVVAVWEHIQEGNGLRVNVTRFGSISRAVGAGIQAEARQLSRFLGFSDVTVQMGKS